jgi:DNA methylase
MGVFIGSIPATRRSLHGERPSPSTAASSFAPPQFFSDERTGAALGGDCVERMRAMPSGSIDFILADPPYLVRYRSHDGRRVANDDNARWLHPAFAEMYRLLKHGSFCVTFYGWHRADQFIAAWHAAGFRIVGHIVFRKRYASSARFLCCEHESAYLLAKGEPKPPTKPIPDVLD